VATRVLTAAKFGVTRDLVCQRQRLDPRPEPSGVQECRAGPRGYRKDARDPDDPDHEPRRRAQRPDPPWATRIVPQGPGDPAHGTINAYRWPEFRAALEASGRKKVIIAGVSSTTCLQFPALDMVGDGDEVYAAIVASGSESQIAREAAIATLSTTASRSVPGSRWPLSWSPTGRATKPRAGRSLPVRCASNEIAWGHLLDIATDYAMGRMTPPERFVEGDETATPRSGLVGAAS
jgi:hypothetical protein